MELSISFLIISAIIFFVLLYIVIETAVRRGIDASDTKQIIEKIYQNETDRY
ncbi:hypothetical protein [Gracilibacillus phocaeensis]|uniref:hypothetical protein n=1 Tax=Gracilibacillus phocaeensis TaxID=2042304 RepID=UPI000A74F30C|nr:hypothetical protein [Gracilibacillus phocaeensis]